jgi:hypothetical protein
MHGRMHGYTFSTVTARKRPPAPVALTTRKDQSMIRATASIQDNPPETLAEIRDLVQEYPFIARKSPEAVSRALRTLRGVEVSDFEVEIAMDALALEDLGVCA